MTPCSRCARHVRHHETSCPFCGAPFAAGPARTFAVVGRVTRAAVFSAALVACSKHEEPPPPAPHAGSAEKLDQDFNQLLGSAEQGSAAVAHVADAAVASDAAQVAVPVDAMSDEERTRQLQHQQDADKQRKHNEQEAQRRRDEEQRLEQQRLEQQRQIDEQHYNAKPYGAPPARRRVV